MIKRYDLESVVKYYAIGFDGLIKKGVVETNHYEATARAASSSKQAIADYEAQVKKNYGSRFVSIKTKVTAVRD